MQAATPNYLHYLANLLYHIYIHTHDYEILNISINVMEKAVNISFSFPSLVSCLINLGEFNYANYKITNSVNDLNKSINTLEKGIKQLIYDLNNFFSFQSRNLMPSLNDFYNHPGTLEDLQKSFGVLFALSVHNPLKDSNTLPAYFYYLGMRLNELYQHTGSTDDLQRCIDAFQQSVETSPDDSSYLPNYLNNLGLGFYNLYTDTEDIKYLKQSIEVLEQAVNKTPDDSSYLPNYLDDLGRRLHDLYKKTENLKYLKQSIEVLEQAVNKTPDDSSYLPNYLDSLGLGFYNLYTDTEDIKYLKRSIEVLEQAVNKTPDDSSYLPNYLSDLGSTLMAFYEQKNRLEYVDRSIKIFEQALEISSPDFPNRADLMLNLGHALIQRYRRKYSEKDIQRAIEVIRSAIQTIHQDSPRLLTYLNNLGYAYVVRYQRTYQYEDLIQSIKAWGTAYKQMTNDSSEFAMCNNNLNEALSEIIVILDRFHRNYKKKNELQDLNTPINICEQILQYIPKTSPHFDQILTSLELHLRDRYENLGNLEDLNRSIQYLEELIEGISQNSPLWLLLPMLANDLAIALRYRYQRIGATGHNQKSIEILHGALQRLPENAPELLEILDILAKNLHDCYTHSGILEYQNLASEVREKAVKKATQGEPLKEALVQFIQVNNWIEIQQVIKKQPKLLSNEVDALLDQFIDNARKNHDAEAEQRFVERRSVLNLIRQKGGLSEVDAIMIQLTQAIQANDLTLIISLCRQALTLIHRDQQPDIWANLHAILASCLTDYPKGDRAESLDQAIYHCHQALEVYTLQAYPERWAAIYFQIAIIYGKHIQGKCSENIDQAIYHYHQTLKVYTFQAYPERWAGVQYNLADAFFDRIQGNRAENLEQAIYHHQQAFKVYTKKSYPEMWAMNQYNLAITYRQRIKGNRDENLECSIHHCEQALDVYTRETFPADWAGVHNILANVYRDRIKGDQAQNLEQALNYYQQALEVFTRQSYPKDWARVQLNMAIAYIKRVRGDKSENLEQAIHHCEQALHVYTRHSYSKDKNWAMTQNTLSSAYLERIQGDKTENLDRATHHCKQSLKISSSEAMPVEWAKAMVNMASSYLYRSIQGERRENLQQAIAAYRQSLEVITWESMPELWITAMRGLAQAYYENANENTIRGGKGDSRTQAINIYHKILKKITREAIPIEWAEIIYKLGYTYTVKALEKAVSEDYVRKELSIDMEKAIAFFYQALGVRTREAMPMEWATTMIGLGGAYLLVVYSNCIGEERAERLDKSIAFYKQALEVITWETMPLQWMAAMNGLGNAYRDCIRGEKSKNLKLSIDTYRDALKLIDRNTYPEAWASIQSELGYTLGQFTSIDDRAKDLEDAIDACQKALEVMTRESMPKDWATAKMSLGNNYWNRIQGDRTDNIEKAIIAYKQALEVRSHVGNLIQDNTMFGLANAYSDRIRGNRADNIEKAITTYEKAFEIVPKEVRLYEWAIAKNNLGIAYWERIYGDRADNIEKAITAHQQSLEVITREFYPLEWARGMSNMAIAYTYRTGKNRTENAENIEKAITMHHQALEVINIETFPFEWATTMMNLAGAYAHRIKGEQTQNIIEKSITTYQKTLEILTIERFPALYQKVQRSIGTLYFNKRYWSDAYETYNRSIEAGNTLLTSAYTEVGRQFEVSQTSGLYANTAYCLLQMDRPAEAFLELEKGKTRLLADALALDNVDLTMLPEAQQNTLKTIREDIRDLEAKMRLLPLTTQSQQDDLKWTESLAQKRESLNHIIETIRADYPDFMPTSIELSEMLLLIPSGGVLVAPLVTSQGSAVFVLPQGITSVAEEHVLFLDGFTYSLFIDLLSGWIGDYFNHCREPKHQGHCETWFATIEKTCQSLWDKLMGPVYERLYEMGLSQNAPVLLMPQGGLGLLPLHAAWRKVNGTKRSFLDDFIIFYAPSGYTLRNSQKRLQEPQRQQSSILAVINPSGDLTFTPFEGEAIAKLFPETERQIICESEATVDNVVQNVSGRSYLHFSCHGFYNWKDPMQSGLVLAQKEPLTLTKIITELNLNSAHIVTLSACETGITNVRQSPDEYLGLPTGFLQAGSPAVVASLWRIEDLSTTLLMEKFYRYHLQDKMKVAEALCQAQLWLRNLSKKDAISILGRLMRRLAAEGAKEKAKKVRDEIARIHEITGPPFDHPYYWAAFHAVGSVL